MFRTFLLILFLCGLTVLSGCLEYRARAETAICPLPSLPRVCLPEVKIPDCEVAPRPRACEPLKRPQPLSETERLQSVARVSTLDRMRAMSR